MSKSPRPKSKRSTTFDTNSTVPAPKPPPKLPPPPRPSALRRSASMELVSDANASSRRVPPIPKISTTVPNIKISSDEDQPAPPQAARPVSPTKPSYATKVIQDLLISSALNLTNTSKLQSNPAHPPLHLQTTTVNFRKFVQKCGFIFEFQDAVENIFIWKNPANTILAMVIYVYLCLYPRLLILAPLIILLALLISYYQKRYPNVLTSATLPSKGKKIKKRSKRSAPVLPEENSVDYLKNMQNIQNMMGMISDGYDAFIPLLKYVDWSDEQTSLRIMQFTVVSLGIASLTIWIVPWRYVFVVAGLGAFIANTRLFKALAKEMSPYLLQKVDEISMQWSEFLATEDDTESATDEITVSVYENQRWWANKGFIPQLLGSERASWSNASGSVALPPKNPTAPEGYEWIQEDWVINLSKVWEDSKYGEIYIDPDEEGWVYTDHQWENPAPRNAPGEQSMTRRRRWIRKARKINVEEQYAGSNNVDEPNLRKRNTEKRD